MKQLNKETVAFTELKEFLNALMPTQHEYAEMIITCQSDRHLEFLEYECFYAKYKSEFLDVYFANAITFKTQSCKHVIDTNFKAIYFMLYDLPKEKAPHNAMLYRFNQFKTELKKLNNDMV